MEVQGAEGDAVLQRESHHRPVPKVTGSVVLVSVLLWFCEGEGRFGSLFLFAVVVCSFELTIEQGSRPSFRKPDSVVAGK